LLSGIEVIKRERENEKTREGKGKYERGKREIREREKGNTREGKQEFNRG